MTASAVQSNGDVMEESVKVTVTSLLPCTPYTITIKPTAEEGDESTSALDWVPFKTTAATSPETLPVTSVSLEPSARSILVHWKAPPCVSHIIISATQIRPPTSINI